MDYPSKKYTAQRATEADFRTEIKSDVARMSLRSKLQIVLVAAFFANWLYLSYLSDGLFMNEACLCGIIVCFLMVFKNAR